MRKQSAIEIFTLWSLEGRHVFTRDDLVKLFPNEPPKTLQTSLDRLVKDKILERVGRGVYVFNFANQHGTHTIEHIAKALRRGEYNYVSLESALSEYGLMSQIPIDRLTVMTTGRAGEFHTPYGTIEFTHTKRNVRDILKSIRSVDRPLRIATSEAALRDLRRVGRNQHLIDKGAV